MRSLAMLLVLPAVLAATEPVSPSLPPWTPGTLDIHHIATGAGNATFFILPNGTSLLVDAGDASALKLPGADVFPDASRPAGTSIARYAKRQLGAAGLASALDTVLLTHIHVDHVNGLADLAKEIPVKRVIDRGWPEYADPVPAIPQVLAPYREALGIVTASGARVERARPGRADQIVESAAGFELRIVASNGEVWTGKGDEALSVFPPVPVASAPGLPDENMCSIALRIRLGAFDYFTGGDLPGVPDPGEPAWTDLETPLAKVLGPLDVSVIGHHGSIDNTNPYWLATTKPRVHVVPAWNATHPSPDVVKRLMAPGAYPGPRDVYVLELREATANTIGPRADRLASRHGHVVVRVPKGGATYEVLVTESRDESDRVLARKAYESR